ncbi:MAG TPA: hypothetical protein ENF22_00395 [Chloroflexi bacterium]|nr:hypothetical protein [Chloroflexota bacterium]
MKRVPLAFSIIIVLSLCLTACIPLNPVPANQQVSEAYIKTAVAGTLVAERAREAGASLSFTATPEGTLDAEETPETEGSEDGAGDEIQDPQPTPENPWMLQSWCAEHEDDCVKYDVHNRTDSWLQVELKESDTGVTGFFSIRKRSISQITLIPGKYTVKYTWWCDGEASSFSVLKSLGSWRDVFKCPEGFYQKVNKQ